MKVSKLLLLGMLAVTMCFADLAIADQEPLDCSANNLFLNITKSTTQVKLGQSIFYTIEVGNSNGTGCLIDNVDVAIQLPAADGTPTGTIVFLETGLSLPVDGSGNKSYAAVEWVCDVLPGVIDAVAEAVAIGVLHDAPTNHQAKIQKTVGTSVVWPGTVVNIASTTELPIACGDSVMLEIKELNDGDDPLTDAGVEVKQDGGTVDILIAPPDSGDTDLDEILDPGEEWVWASGPHTVNALTTFTAIGHGIDSTGEDITSPDYPAEEMSIEIDCQLQPKIAVEKTVDCEEAVEGYPVTYTICISNTGPVPVEITSVIDTVLGDLTADFLAECAVLVPGEQCCLPFGPFVLPAEPDPFPNEVTVMAEDEIAQVAGPEIDDAEVDIVHPDLTVTKVCLTDPIEGDTALFEITIENTGDVDLSIMSDEAELLGPLDLVVGQIISIVVERPVDGQDVYNEINVVATLLDREICVEEGYEILRSDDDTCTVMGDTFCSFTQGFWGNAGGTKCDPALTTTELLNALIPPSVIVGSGANTIEFVTPQDVLDGLPAGGKPKALNTGNVTYSQLTPPMVHNKTGAVRNVLVGQVVALTLNIRTSAGCLPEGASGDLGALTLAAEFCTVPYDDPEACPEQVTIPEPLVGKTVAEILELANIALGGGELPEGITLGMLYEAASSINEGLDECRTIVSCPEGEICDNGCDDDFDGDVDCEDEDCDEDPACVD